MSTNFLDFSGTRIDTKRPLTSYTKIQMLYGAWLRRSRKPVDAARIRGLEYLNVGCGPNMLKSFINMDYWWQPGIDICCDITQGVPLPSASVRGVFTEHCLEHIPFEACQQVLCEFRRVLKPGGTARIVVPDAELFLRLYMQASERPGGVTFPFSDEYPRATPMMHVNRIFRDHGHLFAYDFETFKYQLERAGFSSVTRRSFREGSEQTLLIDSEYRKPESLYIEAIVR